MYLIFFVMIFKIEAIYQNYVGKSYKIVENTHKKMRVFAGFYFALEVLFHSLAIFVPDTHEEKELSLYILASVTLILDTLMFVNFLTKVRQAVAIIDQMQPKSKCYRILRICLFILWFLIFILDIVFITFLRPAGSVYFANQEISKYADNINSPMAIARKLF